MTTVANVAGCKLESTVTLVTCQCGKCGGTYAILDRVRDHCQLNNTDWHCPYCQNGHGFSYRGPETQRQKELQDARFRAERAEVATQRARDERDTAERRCRGQKAAKTRLVRKVARGLCPCCGKRFADLGEHMATKHASYGQADKP